MNTCSVKKLERLVGIDTLLVVGEVAITILPNKYTIIKWNSFNSATDTCRVLSGAAETESASGGSGYKITAGTNGATVALTNKYRINSFNGGDGDEPAYIIQAEDFAYHTTPLTLISRAKVVGNLTKMFEGNTVGYCEYCDFSEAEGVLEVSYNIYILRAIIPAPNVALGFNTAMTRVATLLGNFKTSELPVEYLAGSNISICFEGVGNTSSALKGNVANLGILSSLLRINANGPELVGDLGAYFVSYAATKNSSSIRFRNADKSNMTIHGISMNGNNDFAGEGVVAQYSATEIVVKYKNDVVILGTYNKSAQTWSWNA